LSNLKTLIRNIKLFGVHINTEYPFGVDFHF